MALTHGQSGIHWERDEHGGAVLDLESLANDFEYAVDQFIAALRADPASFDEGARAVAREVVDGAAV